MKTILKTEALSHRYGASWAIRDINIEIASRGIVGLLGSNGAGKSTTMNIICGVLNQTEGTVYIDGVDIRKEPELAKRKIGFLPQNPPVYNDLTVDEYLQYAAELRLIPKNEIKKAVEEAKEKVGITHFSSRLIGNLSGGYRQRVGIAQAIIHKPELVVMDEPTNGLDPNQLIEARKLIQEIGAERAVLLSSHVLPEINHLCNDIIMIESGRVIFSDTMEAFNSYADTTSLFVRLENPPTPQELQRIRGVENVEAIGSKEFRVFFNGDKSVSESIVESAVQNGWQLREISFEKGGLDEIFKQLSKQHS